MAYGGVAQTYCLWKLEGESFKENNAQYIYVLHPITKAKKKVRWYTDKKHVDLMPQSKDKYGPLYKVFGFKNADDEILMVRKKHITTAEEAEYFGWQRGWRFGMFFGGIWYAPKEVNGIRTELPPIAKRDMIIPVTWTLFKQAGQAHSKELGMVSEKESCWFKEEIA